LPPVAVRVTGHDYTWRIRYAGADGRFETADDVTTERHLHLPERARATIELCSDDYVYTIFWPHIDRIETAFPGQPFALALETDSPATHEMLGSQMCGYTHAELLGTVVVQTRTEFDMWLRAAAARPAGLGDDGCYHVRAGEDIQDAIERAAADPVHKTVRVHAGTYRPRVPGQALIWFHAVHDGVALEAVGDVTLTAANPEIAARGEPSFPAVVNHVVYFGDGVSGRTSIDGFSITGANGFVTDAETRGPIEPSTRFPKTLFFYADGGAIKIFGESYPTLRNLTIHDNYAAPCAGGISVHHPHSFEDPRKSPLRDEAAVRIEGCVFRDNRALVTGSAVDLLWGSSAVLENCLFVGNVSNVGKDFTVPDGEQPQYDPEHGCGALTVFWGSRVRVSRCTFTGNYNGIDDMSVGNRYEHSIFWRNDLAGGIATGKRYAVALRDGSGMSGCFLRGEIDDLRGNVGKDRNVLGAPDPDFDAEYRPRAPAYRDAGYRPPAR
jgi:hypothetical protein